MKKPFVAAHRGFSGIYPENTMLAFEKAVELRPEFMECDVHMTKDNKVVVMHDEKLDRTTNGTGLIMDHTLEEIKKLDAGSKKDPKFAGVQVPTLEELLDLAKGKVAVCIEIKAILAVWSTVSLIKQFNMEDEVIIFSFMEGAIREAKAHCPQLTTLQLRWFKEPLNMTEISAQVLGSGANWIGINHDVMNEERTRFFQRRGISVACWTVNQEDRMQAMIDSGVDTIISDFPNKVQGLLK